MIKKDKQSAARKPRVAVLLQEDLARVTGGDSGKTKIRETVVAD